MNNFKVKSIATHKEFSIFLVDGERVRNEAEIEFTNYAHYYEFPKLIPEKELWIDQTANEVEWKFFILNLVTSYRGMKEGLSWDDAEEFADKAEKEARKKANEIPLSTEPKGVRLSLIKKTSFGQFIWLVDGRKVREWFDVEFTEGANDKARSYVPHLEVWIEDVVSESEQPFIIIHELGERRLMTEGESYDEAHKAASSIEHHARHMKPIKESLLAELTGEQSNV